MESLEKRFFRAATEEEVLREMLSRLEMGRAEFLDNIASLDFKWESNGLIVLLDVSDDAPEEIREKILSLT